MKKLRYVFLLIGAVTGLFMAKSNSYYENWPTPIALSGYAIGALLDKES